MDIKKFLLGISLGYVFALLMVYILFDYFSWSIALGFLLGIHCDALELDHFKW